MVFRKTLQVLTILLSALSVPLLAFGAGRKSSTETYLEQLHNQGKERVIVLFENEADPDLIAAYNVKLIRKLKILNALVCEINQSDIELLKQEPNIKNVVPDMVIKVPRPKKPPKKWEEKVNEEMDLLFSGPATVRWNNLEAGLNSKAAWDRYNLDGTGITIAFIDTGVNYTLADLDDNYLGGYDYVSGDDDPINPTPDETHGTEVVSLAVGEGVDKVVGVSYNAGYYVVRVLEGPCPATGLISAVIAGMQWASTEPHKADIISMSLGTDGNEPGWVTIWEPALRKTCNLTYEKGIVLVAASGNAGSTQCEWPAAFSNVIAVGAHAEDQALYSDSNGGVDVVAPGDDVYTVCPDNSAWLASGTSLAVPHVSGLIALQLQYARENNIEVNNGYLWEVMKHSAVDLGENPVYQGKGKTWAARTDANNPNIGSIDLIASNWPTEFDFEFSDYAFIDTNYPVYHIGSDVNQAIILTNITDILGNYPETIENLNVTATQGYYADSNEPNLPGDSIKVFPTISLLQPGDGNSITLSLLYTIPPQTTPSLKQTKLELEFNFAGNNRTLKVSYNQPNSLWYAAIPGDFDLSNNIDLIDFSTFAQHWQQTDCNVPVFCGRADVDQSGDVDWPDLSILAQNWLSDLTY